MRSRIRQNAPREKTTGDVELQSGAMRLTGALHSWYFRMTCGNVFFGTQGDITTTTIEYPGDISTTMYRLTGELH